MKKSKPAKSVTKKKSSKSKTATKLPAKRTAKKKVAKRGGAPAAKVKEAPSFSKMRIGALISPLPYTIGRQQTLAKAHTMMREHNIRHLPVLDGGKLVGMLSQRDLHLIETFKQVDQNVVKVEEALSREPFSVRYDATVAEVATVMAQKKFGAVVVVDDDEQVIGVFTTVDALRALASA